MMWQEDLFSPKKKQHLQEVVSIWKETGGGKQQSAHFKDSVRSDMIRYHLPLIFWDLGRLDRYYVRWTLPALII